MTELEYQILTYVSSNNDVHWIDMLNALHSGYSYKEIGTTAKHLLTDEVLENCTPAEHPPYCRIRLSEEGNYDLLKEKSVRAEYVRTKQEQDEEYLKQVIADKTERKAEKRADRISQILFAFLNTLLSILAGIVIEYHASVIELIKHFFEQ